MCDLKLVGVWWECAQERIAAWLQEVYACRGWSAHVTMRVRGRPEAEVVLATVADAAAHVALAVGSAKVGGLRTKQPLMVCACGLLPSSATS